jgi:hypothetical protein
MAQGCRQIRTYTINGLLPVPNSNRVPPFRERSAVDVDTIRYSTRPVHRPSQLGIRPEDDAFEWLKALNMLGIRARRSIGTEAKLVSIVYTMLDDESSIALPRALRQDTPEFVGHDNESAGFW